ncbi:hypothetical protein [uncultured Roseobacter sp.]|uniref:hypothetical protein n=1 Tax=uncultured Roseobacter sp. TaxID=114847 RepID=UPI0026278D02|nr:hypothetical protein [uncultured Roseobacter sp.]
MLLPRIRGCFCAYSGLTLPFERRSVTQKTQFRHKIWPKSGLTPLQGVFFGKMLRKSRIKTLENAQGIRPDAGHLIRANASWSAISGRLLGRLGPLMGLSESVSQRTRRVIVIR